MTPELNQKRPYVKGRTKKQYRKEYYQANPEYWKEKHRQYLEDNPAKYLYRIAKHRAKKKGIAFTIELSDVVIPEKCPYLGTPINMTWGEGRKWYNPSLDRIDNTKGYIKGNVQVISDRANRMKVDTSIEELIEFAKGVLRHHTGIERNQIIPELSDVGAVQGQAVD